MLLNIYSPRAAATEFSDDVLQQKTTTTVTTNFSFFFVFVIIAITTFVRAIDQLLDSRRIGGVTNLNLNFLFKKKQELFPFERAWHQFYLNTPNRVG